MSVPKGITGTGSTQVATGPAIVRGWSIREAAGTPARAVVRLWDNSADSGTLLAVIDLPAAGISQPGDGLDLRAQVGVRAQVVSGTVEGSVFLGAGA